MSRAVTFPRLVDPNGDEPGIEREDYLIEIQCLQDGCAWWIKSEQACSVKWSTLMLWALAEIKGDDR